MTTEIPDDLIDLQRTAEVARVTAHAQPYTAEGWRPWLDAAAAFQAAVTAHAVGAGVDRYGLEMAVKKAVADEGAGTPQT